MTHLAEHPAKFSPEILAKFKDIIEAEFRYRQEGPLILLDPFAGTGRIHELMNYFEYLLTVGIEIEPEWAEYSRFTSVGNALDLPYISGHFDIVATSPTYGNRMADHHDAKDDSKRITYTHKIGRPLHPDNSGAMHWGPKYWDFHTKAWTEARRVLRLDGLLIVNVKDFIAKKERVRVGDWHIETITSLGFNLLKAHEVEVKGMGFGANSKSRIGYEYVLVFRKKNRI